MDASLAPTNETDMEGSWKTTGLSIHCCNETECEILQRGFTKSDIYQWLHTPLDYKADFEVRLIPVSDSKTQVDVATSEAEVRIGPNFSAQGGDYYERVAPTTIEEYKILLKIGKALGQPGMPPLVLPK